MREDVKQILAKTEYSVQDLETLQTVYQSEDQVDEQLLLEVTRCLRNACALEQCKLDSTFAATVTSMILQRLRKAESETTLSLIRCSFQLLHNLITRLDDVKVVESSLDQACFQALKHPDAKVRNYASSVINVCLNKCPELLDRLISPESLTLLLECVKSESQFAWNTLKLILFKHEKWIDQVFETLNEDAKVMLLDCVAEVILEKELPAFIVQMIVSQFKGQANQILTSFQRTSSSLSPQVLLRLLSILCDISSEEVHPFGIGLRSDKSLLLDTLYLLKMVHEAGKSDTEGLYAPITKVAQMENANAEESPVYGFKRDLIRLVGNLCWKHKENQDTVRELDGLQLLLDCSQIDGKNPFILQWVVFAIRNLCENNQENQATISAIDGKGVMVQTLENDLGIQMKK